MLALSRLLLDFSTNLSWSLIGHFSAICKNVGLKNEASHLAQVQSSLMFEKLGRGGT